MNPLVEQMLNATVSNDVETRLLEDLFEHEVKCEARHHWENCTDAVTHQAKSCDSVRNVCDDAAQYVRDGIASIDYCQSCGRDCSKCWTIRPI